MIQPTIMGVPCTHVWETLAGSHQRGFQRVDAVEQHITRFGRDVLGRGFTGEQFVVFLNMFLHQSCVIVTAKHHGRHIPKWVVIPVLRRMLKHDIMYEPASTDWLLWIRRGRVLQNAVRVGPLEALVADQFCAVLENHQRVKAPVKPLFWFGSRVAPAPFDDVTQNIHPQDQVALSTIAFRTVFMLIRNL